MTKAKADHAQSGLGGAAAEREQHRSACRPAPQKPGQIADLAYFTATSTTFRITNKNATKRYPRKMKSPVLR